MISNDEALMTEIDDRCCWKGFIFLLWEAWCDACKKVAIEQETLLKEETNNYEAMFKKNDAWKIKMNTVILFYFYLKE